MKMQHGVVFILLGAFLWGTIGFFVKKLYEVGFSPMEVVTIRVSIAAVFLITYSLFFSKSTFRLNSMKDLKYFIGTGILSITLFNYCMFKTIQLSTIQISAALLYTGPAFVILISYFVLKEPITKTKIYTFILTLIGVLFVIELFPIHMHSLPMTTIIIGLCSGLGYALYSIFSKLAAAHYNSLTITTYTFICSAFSLLPFFPYVEKMHFFLQTNVLFYAIGLGVIPTGIAYILYTYGLVQVEASKAAILSTIEPVVATLISIFIFLEPFTYSQIFGIICIIFAVILLERKQVA